MFFTPSGITILTRLVQFLNIPGIISSPKQLPAKLTLLRLEQASKVRPPEYSKAAVLSKLTVSSFVQSSKTHDPKTETFAGIVILVSPDLANASSPISVTFSTIEMLVKFSQRSKACLPIVLTFSGIEKLVNGQFVKQ